MRNLKQFIISSGIIFQLMTGGLLAASKAEVMHWWTSPGEAKAVNVVKKAYNKTGNKWIDSSSVGGGGGNMLTRLEARVSTGTPPTAVQMYMGPKTWYWGEEGALANMNSVANKEHWSKILPPIINKMIKYEGNYVSVPINVHRINWLYTNSKVFKKAGAKIPHNWNEFWVAADKIKKAGYTPLAIGGQDWQEVTLFESVLLGIAGTDFYRKALVDLDQKALKSPIMVKVFDIMRRLKKYTDNDAPGRGWDVTTKMVIDGKAGMQFMGDWAAGEFMAAGKKPGRDFKCVTAPGTEGKFVLLTNVFTMFQVKGKSAQNGQKRLAEIIMNPKVQEEFNLYKGSIPARIGISPKHFNACARKSMRDFKTASSNNQVIPSFAYYHAGSPEAKDAITKLVDMHFKSNMSSQVAVKKMAAMLRGLD